LDQHRPEARRFRRIASEFRSDKKKLVLFPEGEVHPFYSTKGFKVLAKKFPDAQICTYSPFLGIIPAEISDVFPASHNVISRAERKVEDYPSFIESVNAFLANNSFEDIIVVADSFMKQTAFDAKLKARVEDYSDHVIERL
jgi:7-cyano-7-deazaguanine tRNA-ribosyltransferase